MNYSLIVGVDESDREYVLTFLSGSGKTLKQCKVKYSGTAVQEVVDDIRKLVDGDLTQVAVVFEKPAGAFQEYLDELAVDVFTITPLQVEALRTRYGNSKKKDDLFDSFVLADSFRTDVEFRQFKRRRQPSSTAMKLMTLTRSCEQLDSSLRRATNQLRVHLHRIAPHLLTLSEAADKVWLWDLLDMAPSPKQQAKLSLAKLTALLKRHRISKITPQELHDLLRQPVVPVADGVVESTVMVIRSMLPLLKVNKSELIRLEKERESFLERLEQQGVGERPNDIAIVDSMVGFGPATTAAVMGYCEAAITDRDLEYLRKRTGVAAVFRGSGKSWHVSQRYACSRTLRNAMFWAANAAVANDEHWKALYARLRAKGKTRGRALRGVADRMLTVLIAMLKNGELYDPKRLTGNAARSTPADPSGSCSTESNKEASPPRKQRAAAKAQVKARGAKRSAQRGPASEH